MDAYFVLFAAIINAHALFYVIIVAGTRIPTLVPFLIQVVEQPFHTYVEYNLASASFHALPPPVMIDPMGMRSITARTTSFRGSQTKFGTFVLLSVVVLLQEGSVSKPIPALHVVQAPMQIVLPLSTVKIHCKIHVLRFYNSVRRVKQNIA